DAGLAPRARVLAGGEPVPLAETLLWRKGDRVVVALIKNPPREAAVDTAGHIDGTFGREGPVEIALSRPVTAVRNLRSGEELPDGKTLTAAWKPWEALLFEVTWPQP
ncbi:MAG TPA: hypothetical protein VM238_18950, partial [Phycisphaerae bacterium]|nr:hypothetical protein [Phycisphaerae bacterium]